VLVNTSSSTKTINVGGVNVPSQFEWHVSNATQKRVMSTVSNTGISMPGNSIGTLVSGQYRGTEPVAVQPQKRDGAVVAAGVLRLAQARMVHIYTLDGKLVRTLRDVAVGADGSVRWDHRDANGRTVAAGTYHSVLVDKAGRVSMGPSFVRM
jgi:hypothetical protein